jgi:hypothetical protein
MHLSFTLGLDRRPGSPDKQGMEKFWLDNDVTSLELSSRSTRDRLDPRGMTFDRCATFLGKTMGCVLALLAVCD